MTFTVSQIAKSLAEYLKDYFEGVTFYEDPLQQGMQAPAMFLQTRGYEIKPQTNRYFFWTLRLDLVYLLDFNLPNLQQQYQIAEEILDFTLETFPYLNEESESTLIRTYNRNGVIDLNELHYKFDLMARITREEAEILMRTLSSNLEVIDGY